jgi:hypothetical protein
MEQKNKWKAYTFTLLIFLSIGELSEIRSQDIAFGDYIKQYALVRIEHPDGTFHRQVCTDCLCYITVYDKDYQKILDKKPMKLLEANTGLYGYQTSSSFLEYGKEYEIVINVESPLYGNGSTPSSIKITNTPSISSATPTGSIGQASSYGVMDDMVKYVTEPLKEFITANNPLSGLTDLFKPILDPIFAFFSWWIELAGLFWGGVVKWIQIMALLVAPSTRSQGFWMMIEWIFGFIYVIMNMFVPVIMLYEVYVIGKSLDKHSFGERLRSMLDDHFKLFNGISTVLYRIWQAIPIPFAGKGG